MVGSATAQVWRICIVLAARWRKCSRAGRYLRDVGGGATAIVAGAVTVMAVGASALIVDHNWLVDQRDVLKSASDAAAVAATMELKRLPTQTTDEVVQTTLQQVAENYVTLNLAYLPEERLTRAKETLTVEVAPNRASSTVDVAASADLGGTLFTRHLPLAGNYTGPEKIAVAAKVESLTVPIEVALAIDVSQSMDNQLDGSPAGHRWVIDESDGSYQIVTIDSRMTIVKRAASQLVDILDPNEENRVAVSVVPWQIVVRLDETARQNWAANGWAAYPTSRHYNAAYACTPEGNCTATAQDDNLPADPGEDWAGCLDEHRVDSGGHADLPAVEDLLDVPSDSAFAQAFFPALQGKAYECLVPPLPGNFRYQICYADDPHDSGRVYDGTYPQWDCRDGTPSILPLTSDRAVIDTAIEALDAIGQRTYSSLGVLWGQRLLTHEWKAVWGDDVHPVDATSGVNEGTRKAIVLLTDGEDNPCGLSDPSCTTNNVGLVRSTACEAAKTEGTEIFVVAAMHPDKVSGDLATSLRACSSEADNPAGTYVFLNNADAESLETAFADIAEQLRVYRRVF